MNIKTLLLSMLTSAACFGASYSPSISSACAPLDWGGQNNVTVSVDKFDGSLGKLKKVSLVFTAEISSLFQIENLSFAFEPIPTWIYSTNNIFIYDVNSDFFDSLTINFSIYKELLSTSLDDNHDDYAGPAGFTTNLVNYSSKVLEYANDLNFFVGPGQITFTADSSSFVRVLTSDVYNSYRISDGCLSLKVIYEYDLPCKGIGTATIGYWKNHLSVWPVNSLILGCRTYSKQELLCILKSSTSDAVTLLQKQLIATKLNILVDDCNEHSCIDDYINRADYLLCKTKNCLTQSIKQELLCIKSKLDDYNNGRLCEKHRD